MLTWPEKVVQIQLEDDGGEEQLTAAEEQVLQARELLISMAQQKKLSIDARAEAILQRVGYEASQLKPEQPEWQRIIRGIERLDPAWDVVLDLLQTADTESLEETFTLPLEQLMVVLLYRHLPAAVEDGAVCERAAVCILLWRLIRALFVRGEQTMDRLIELCRMMSAELEYSEEAMDVLIDAAASV